MISKIGAPEKAEILTSDRYWPPAGSKVVAATACVTASVERTNELGSINKRRQPCNRWLAIATADILWPYHPTIRSSGSISIRRTGRKKKELVSITMIIQIQSNPQKQSPNSQSKVWNLCTIVGVSRELSCYQHQHKALRSECHPDNLARKLEIKSKAPRLKPAVTYINSKKLRLPA